MLSALGGDADIILPPKESPIVKLAPAAGTVKLSPVSLAPRTETGAIRLGGHGASATEGGPAGKTVKPATEGPGAVPAAPVAATTAKHGTVRLTGNQTEAAKTAKHGTVRLTGNQTEAAKTAKHGTVRLTGNQTEAAKTAASAMASVTAAATPTAPLPASIASPAAAPAAAASAAKEEKTAKKDKPRRKKAPKPRRSNGGQDPWAGIVFVLLVILVVLLYVGFFIVRPKIIAARSVAQPAPVPAETAQPGPRKPAAKPRPAAKAKATAKPAPSAVKPKPVADKPAQATDSPVSQTPPAGDSAKARQGGAAPGAVTGNGLGEVDVPEDNDPAEGASAAAIPPAVEEPKPASKYAPPWARKDTPAQPEEEKPKEVVIEVPAAVDVPEVREWPELRVTAVIGSGKKGSVLVNGTVVSVGEELEEGPVLKSVTRQAAIFEWDGDRRTIYVSSKSE
ncbi:MAG: hypothetical protein IJK04_08895 [Kiritimatiellae bacterium]|nr:hypothetical protein [Kiritimatiellia bacterium]